MKLWEVPWAGASAIQKSGGLCQVLDALGSTHFSRILFEVLDQQVPIGLLIASSLEIGNLYRGHWVETGAMVDRTFALSRMEYFCKGRWRGDPGFQVLRRLWSRPADFEPMLYVQQLPASAIRDREWRENSYTQGKLVDRIVLAAGHPNIGWILLTLVRHASQGLFQSDEIDWLRSAAPIYMRLLMRHENVTFSARQSMANLETAQLRLQQVRNDLTKQETAVCSRILQGKSFEEIGKEMGIGLETVKTYRSRAFRRLGISSRFELLSIFIT